MKRSTDEYVIKAKKIDTKTVIIFGDYKHPDDFYYGKNYSKLKSFEPIPIDITVLMGLFGKPKINLENEYSNNVNVYHLRETKDKNGNKRTVGFITRQVPGFRNQSINIGVYDWPTTDVYWLPSENLINNSYMCSKTENCYYTTNRKKNLERHEKKCTDVQEIISKQLGYGSRNDQVSKVGHLMNMDFSQIRQKHHVCYDIETFGKNEVCVPVSIAVASTFAEPKYFEKTDDTPEATYQMVSEFMNYLVELQQKLLDNLEPEIQQAISFLQAEKEETFNPKKYHSKAELFKLLHYFKNFGVLKVFGFNSRYCKPLHFTM